MITLQYVPCIARVPYYTIAAVLPRCKSLYCQLLIIIVRDDTDTNTDTDREAEERKHHYQSPQSGCPVQPPGTACLRVAAFIDVLLRLCKLHTVANTASRWFGSAVLLFLKKSVRSIIHMHACTCSVLTSASIAGALLSTVVTALRGLGGPATSADMWLTWASMAVRMSASHS